MAKPSESGGAGKLEVKVDPESIPTYNSNIETKTVYIQSVFDARLLYTGQVSGKQYVWNKAGDICEVDMLDSEILLAKRMGGTGCCGNSNKDENKVFVKFT